MTKHDYKLTGNTNGKEGLYKRHEWLCQACKHTVMTVSQLVGASIPAIPSQPEANCKGNGLTKVRMRCCPLCDNKILPGTLQEHIINTHTIK